LDLGHASSERPAPEPSVDLPFKRDRPGDNDQRNSNDRFFLRQRLRAMREPKPPAISNSVAGSGVGEPTTVVVSVS
jgi:hypothetical protein